MGVKETKARGDVILESMLEKEEPEQGVDIGKELRA